MKRLAVLLLIISLVFMVTACGTNSESSTPGDSVHISPSSSNEPTTPTTTETIVDPTYAAGVSAGNLTLGYIRFEIPDGFQPHMVDDHTYLLFSEDTECYFSVFSYDISELTEDQLLLFLPIQRENFMTEGAVQIDKTVIDGYVAGCDIPINYYGEMDDDLNVTSNMEMTFADSRYSYTIQFICKANNEHLTDYVTTFVEFTAYAKHLTGETQFTFVQ